MINENSGAKLPKLNLTSPGQSDGEKLEVWPTSAREDSSQPSVVDTAHAREETPSNALSPSMLRAVQKKQASISNLGTRPNRELAQGKNSRSSQQMGRSTGGGHQRVASAQARMSAMK